MAVNMDFDDADIQSVVSTLLSKSPNEELGRTFEEKLKSVIDMYNNMEEGALKERFERAVKEVIADKIVNELEKPGGKIPELLQEQMQSYIIFTVTIFIVAVVVITVLCVFFGYKLYKSITDKESKREEKRKAKQLKKKK